MKISKERLSRQFDRSASTYDEHATIHKHMAHRILLSLKEQIPDPGKILEIGCGTGYLTQLIIDHYPQAMVTAVDISQKMIEMAKEKLVSTSPVQFMVGDAERMDWVKQGPFDLIVSNATLHWLNTPLQSISNCFQALKPDGWLVASTYGPDTFHELSTIFQRVELELGLEPVQHHMTLRTAEEWERLMKEAGFPEVNTVECWQRFTYKDCRYFLQSIKAMGESYSEASHNLTLTRTVLMEVMNKYNLAYRVREGVYATYHLIQLKAQKQNIPSPSFFG